MITFYFLHHKQYCLDNPLIMSGEEFVNTDSQDFPPNHHCEPVTVASEADKAAWIAAKNAWLSAFWTPNQDEDERRESAIILREAEQTMDALNHDNSR